MKRLLFLFLCLAFLPFAFTPPPARADDSDIFMSYDQPNVMILLDNSGSMAWGIPSVAYDHNRVPAYPLRQMCKDISVNCQTNRVYKGMGIHPSGGYPRYSSYADSISDVTDADARQKLTTDGFWFGTIKGSQVHLYLGNYLNYLYCPDCTGAQSRIEAAKDVLKKIANNVEGVRFGVMAFNQSPPGAAMVAPIGTNKGTMLTAIDGITTGGGTPLGGQLMDAGKYFSGIFQGYASPIQSTCQANFVILITDGMQTDTMSSNAVQTQAGLLYRQDHSSSLPGTQVVITNTIGFALTNVGGEDEVANARIALQATADNGHGDFVTAETEAQLEEAILKTLQKILEGTFAFATPTIPTTSTTGINRAYMAAFKTSPTAPYWRGFLKAYNRDTNGLVKTDVNGKPREDLGCTVPDPDHEGQTLPCLAWEAGKLLGARAAAGRIIYTVRSSSHARGTAPELFTTDNGNITADLLGFSGVTATTANREMVINIVRNGIMFEDTDDEDGDGITDETLPWKLGDIYHSTPVVVTKPFLPSQDASYKQFRTTWGGRTPIVIVSANDGMLHAFQESDGSELWAFIPPDVLPRLKALTPAVGQHPYLLDLSPIAADVKIDTGDGQGIAWHTIVVFGERRGGKYYHALDISDTGNPKYLWSITDPEILETWSEPVIGKVKVLNGSTVEDRYVAIFGGGYDTPNNNQHGRGLFVVDLANGSKIWDYKTTAAPDTNSTTSCDSSDDRTCMNYSIAANPLALDLNSDGYIDRVYIGDIGGQLWKFDLSKTAQLSGSPVAAATCADATSTNCWMGKRFFRAGNDTNPPARGEYYPTQPIYSAPNAALDANHALWIYFGTGDRNHPRRATLDPNQNRFYGIKDTTTMSSALLTETALQNVTTSVQTISQGWYVTLGANEKDLAQSDVFNSVVFFATFTPDTISTCGSGGGTSKLYAVQLTTGYAAINWSGSTTEVVLCTLDCASNDARSKDIGTGIPSKPMVILTDTGAVLTTSVVASTTNQQMPSNPAPPPANMRRILYWLERF